MHFLLRQTINMRQSTLLLICSNIPHVKRCKKDKYPLKIEFVKTYDVVFFGNKD